MGRPGYKARLLQILALLPLIRICCQHAEDYELILLAAIRSNESGLEVRTLFPEYYGSSRVSQWSNYDLEPQMDLYFIPNHSLSSECGDQYFRCQKLLVSVCAQNDSGELSIIFVPLENGVLLLSYWHNSLMIERSIFIVNSSNCSPTVFYNIDSKVYTVCINSYHLNVAVYEVQLNLSGSVTKLEGAEFIEPLVTSINLPSSQPLSNIINVDHMIFFAVGNTIIVMDILDKTQTHRYPELSECTQIYKLISITGTGNQKLLVVYCTDRYIYFDPVYGDWTSTPYYFSSNGVPYLCPDNSYRVTHFINDTLHFSVKGVLMNTISNVNISGGICFESQNRTYFAYSDQQCYNVNVYHFTTQNYYPVSPYDCSATPHKDCPQLFFLENQYLVIRDAICNRILDATMNFSLLINTSSGIADILTILHINAHSTSEKTTSPGTTSTLISFRSPDHTNSVIFTPLITSTADVGPGISQSESPTLITLVSSLEYISTHTSSTAFATPISTVNDATVTTYTDAPTSITVHTDSSPLSTASDTPISTLNNANVTTYTDAPTSIIVHNNSSPLSTAFATPISTVINATVTTYTDVPTSITVRNNSVGIILTAVIGLIVIIIILVTVAISFSIRRCRRKKR